MSTRQVVFKKMLLSDYGINLLKYSFVHNVHNLPIYPKISSKIFGGVKWQGREVNV